MNLLLDTHVWLWGLLEPARIPKRLATLLSSEETTLWLSPISIWEALLLAERGRIRVPGKAADWMQAALSAGPWHEAALSIEVTVASRTLRIASPDPADRFIAATASVHGLTLATADRRLARVAGVEVLAVWPSGKEPVKVS